MKANYAAAELNEVSRDIDKLAARLKGLLAAMNKGKIDEVSTSRMAKKKDGLRLLNEWLDDLSGSLAATQARNERS